MTAPLFSASPGEPDAGRQTELPHSGCRPSRITFPSSQKSITALIDSDTEWDCFIIVVLAVLKHEESYSTSKFICSRPPHPDDNGY